MTSATSEETSDVEVVFDISTPTATDYHYIYRSLSYVSEKEKEKLIEDILDESPGTNMIRMNEEVLVGYSSIVDLYEYPLLSKYYHDKLGWNRIEVKPIRCLLHTTMANVPLSVSLQCLQMNMTESKAFYQQSYVIVQVDQYIEKGDEQDTPTYHTHAQLDEIYLKFPTLCQHHHILPSLPSSDIIPVQTILLYRPTIWKKVVKAIFNYKC